MMKITRLEYQYVEDYKFYRVCYVIDDYYKHLTFIQDRDVDTTVPEVLVSSLRGTLECQPKELTYARV